MKLILHAIRIKPNTIEEIKIEDVANFIVNDNMIVVFFNNGDVEEISLRANDGEKVHEWSGFSIFATRIGLKIDMSK